MMQVMVDVVIAAATNIAAAGKDKGKTIELLREDNFVARKNDKIKIQSKREEGRTQGSRNLRRLASIVSSACSSEEKLFSEEDVPIRSSIFLQSTQGNLS